MNITDGWPAHDIDLVAQAKMVDKELKREAAKTEGLITDEDGRLISLKMREFLANEFRSQNIV